VPEICIGSFRAASKLIRPNRDNEYYAELTNCTNKSIKVFIVFDIYKYYSSRPSEHPRDHHAYYGKWINLGPYRNDLKIVYNWSETIKFEINGATETSDDKWIGPMDQEGLYSIHLFLKNGNETFELIIFQELNKIERINSSILEMFGILEVVDICKIIVKKNCGPSKPEVKDKLFLCGKDRDMISKVKDYFCHYDNSNLTLHCDDLMQEDALKRSLILCDPSIKPSDLTGILNAWLNGIPLLISENSVIGDICKISNSGLSFENFDEFKSCLDFLLNNEKAREAIGNCNRHFGEEIYIWVKFLSRLKEYIDTEN
jgi:glycosyltransferase involved in cell wall biosynthesis